MISFQARVAAWARKIFGYEVASNVPERTLRFVEEAAELAQACGASAAELHRLIDYVFSRPTGEPAKEIAGSMVTLYALASALDVDADKMLEAELVRIHRPEVIERVLRRQQEKRAVINGSSEDVKAQRDALWQLLDDIDTLDDACRSDDLAFRNEVYRIQQRRWMIYKPKEDNARPDAAGAKDGT